MTFVRYAITGIAGVCAGAFGIAEIVPWWVASAMWGIPTALLSFWEAMESKE